MNNPIKPYIKSITFEQTDVDGHFQQLVVVFQTEGAGHYVRLRTEEWDMDVDELESLYKDLRHRIQVADDAWDEASSSSNNGDVRGEQMVMNCDQWKEMVLDGIRDGMFTETTLEWIGDAILNAYEDGDGYEDGYGGNESVFGEIEARERRIESDWENL